MQNVKKNQGCRFSQKQLAAKPSTAKKPGFACMVVKGTSAIGRAMGGWVHAGGWRGWRKEGMNKTCRFWKECLERFDWFTGST